MNKRWYAIALGAILLLAAGLRLAGLNRTGLATDEAFSIQLAALSPGDILRGTAADQHPPLYYLLLHSWMKMVGQSVVSVRLLSALVGWITVPLLYRIGRRFGTEAGLLAAGLLAISPAHIWFSQQARMYILLVLLGSLSTWAAWRWWAEDAGRTWPRSLFYLVVTLAALYTQYFALLLVVAQTIAGLLLYWPRANHRRWRLAGGWMAIQAVVLAGFLPWLPIMVKQALQHQLTWIPPLSWPLVRHSWLYLLYGGDWQGTVADAAGAALGLVIVVLAVWPMRTPLHADDRLDRGWLVLWFCGPVLLVIALALFSPIYQDKQLLIVLLPLTLLLALGMLRARQWLWRGLLLAVVVALTLLPLYQLYVHPQQEHWDDLAAYLQAHTRPGDLLYLNAAAGSLALDYYLTTDLPRAGYPADYSLHRGGWAGEMATDKAVSAQLTPLAEQYPRIWLVEFSPGFWDPDGLIVTWLQDHLDQVQDLRFGDVRLRLFSREVVP
jgi:mannosyltransferase